MSFLPVSRAAVQLSHHHVPELVDDPQVIGSRAAPLAPGLYGAGSAEMEYGRSMSESDGGSRVPTDAILRKVRGVNPFEETVERIVQAIKLGLIPPGDRLPPERELSVRLGVSRVTLRGAIRALQQAGYIESRRGRTGGSFVTYALPNAQPGDAQEIAQKMGDSLLDVLIFREALEPGAAELAARRDDLTEQQKDTLMTCLQEAGDASADSCRLTDSRLHIYIAELSGSQRLVDSIADVQLMLSDVLAAIPLLEDAIVHSNDQHAAIVKAILSGQADEARKVMSSHVNATSLLLQGFLAL